MELYAKIMTDDKRFERMLSLELLRNGIELISDIDSLSKKLTADNFFTVVDLDLFSEDISELASGSKVIGFSHLYESELGRRAESCYAFFHRPFLISEFISVFYDGKPVRRSGIIKRSGKPAVHERRDHIRLDKNERCISFGRERAFLTGTEFRLMLRLYEDRGKAVSREELSAALGSKESNLVDVHICMIRKKTEEIFGTKLIYTVRGKGYMLK